MCYVCISLNDSITTLNTYFIASLKILHIWLHDGTHPVYAKFYQNLSSCCQVDLRASECIHRHDCPFAAFVAFACCAWLKTSTFFHRRSFNYVASYRVTEINGRKYIEGKVKVQEESVRVLKKLPSRAVTSSSSCEKFSGFFRLLLFGNEIVVTIQSSKYSSLLFVVSTGWANRRAWVYLKPPCILMQIYFS